MASTCPKCHQPLADDSVCCADVTYTWKCKQCSKLSTGFVAPYGKCNLCGGQLEVVKPYDLEDKESIAIVEEALQLEMNTYLFYKIARDRTANMARRDVLEEMRLKELDHVETLESKYHIHLPTNALEVPANVEKIIGDDLFRNIKFEDNDACLKGVYERAIVIEKRTRDMFKRRAAQLPDGVHKEILRELAAEEEEHIAILETEMATFDE
jgi:glutamate synthase (NADPH/NADH) small chain